MNDAPQAAASFEAYTAVNGRPRELQAVAELAEATADGGVGRCLGRTSFARTVWYRVPAGVTAQEIAVEAAGRTLDVVDLAAFVQPPGADAPLAWSPNACSGVGSGGADAAEEPTSGLSLHVPAGSAVLIQVGRRGRAGSPDDERVYLSLDTRPLAPVAAPPGDVAGADTATATTRRATRLALVGATITGEDPAQPACPSLGTVWRRLVPGRTGTRLISVEGGRASALTIFRGRRPTAANAIDCVLRSRPGALQMRTRVRKGRPLWIRVGADRPPAGATALLRLEEGKGAVVVDGGPGGLDPTPGGPGGGLPLDCVRADAARARISGPRLDRGLAAANSGDGFAVALVVRRSAVCDVELVLRGRGGRIFAHARAIRLKGRHIVRLKRTRRLTRGRYRLQVLADSGFPGGRVAVPISVRGRLR
jgi:hypothetical protein